MIAKCGQMQASVVKKSVPVRSVYAAKTISKKINAGKHHFLYKRVELWIGSGRGRLGSGEEQKGMSRLAKGYN